MSSENRSLTKQFQVPFEKEILRFLLTHEANITNIVIRDFVRRYVKWMYACAEKESEIMPGGGIKLQRWQSEEGGSYGYDPSSIAYSLIKLNQLFFTVMGHAYIRNSQQEVMQEEHEPFIIHLLEDIIRGFSSCLGYYVLDCYFATTSDKKDKTWFNQLRDVFGEFEDLETWRPNKDIENAPFVREVLGSANVTKEPYYHAGFPEYIRLHDPRSYQAGKLPAPPQTRHDYREQPTYNEGFGQGYSQGHKQGYQQCMQETNRLFSGTALIIEAERKRLVDFMRILRQALDILEEDPLLVDNQWQDMHVKQDFPNGNQSE